MGWNRNYWVVRHSIYQACDVRAIYRVNWKLLGRAAQYASGVRCESHLWDGTETTGSCGTVCIRRAM